MTIRTAQQLKGLVRNLSKGDSAKAQMLMRSYATERFLERLSLSRYAGNLILKGGTLVAAMVGLDARSTMDIDATLKRLPLTEAGVLEVVGEVCSVPLDDGTAFAVGSVEGIMDEGDYPGVRVHMEALLGRIRIPMKLDFTTDDAITPRELEFPYGLMFEDRAIPVIAYNVETLLAEKLETLVARGVANTRMRDFYDLYVLEKTKADLIDEEVLRRAFANTCGKRGTRADRSNVDLVFGEVESSATMEGRWLAYSANHEYASGIAWAAVLESAGRLLDAAKA